MATRATCGRVDDAPPSKVAHIGLSRSRGASPAPEVSWSLPTFRFDLGAVIGHAMLVAVLAILTSRWQARIRSRPDTIDLD